MGGGQRGLSPKVLTGALLSPPKMEISSTENLSPKVMYSFSPLYAEVTQSRINQLQSVLNAMARLIGGIHLGLRLIQLHAEGIAFMAASARTC